MDIDISGVLYVVSALVSYIRSISFNLGSYTVDLWEIILVMGVTESISFILGLYHKSQSEDE